MEQLCLAVFDDLVVVFTLLLAVNLIGQEQELKTVNNDVTKFTGVCLVFLAILFQFHYRLYYQLQFQHLNRWTHRHLKYPKIIN